MAVDSLYTWLFALLYLLVPIGVWYVIWAYLHYRRPLRDLPAGQAGPLGGCARDQAEHRRADHQLRSPSGGGTGDGPASPQTAPDRGPDA